MKIDKENIDAYFLDYLEENLSENEKHELLSFLDKNPELKSEFIHINNVELNFDKSIKYVEKDNLKFPKIDIDNYEEFAIDYIENNLNLIQKEAFEQFLRNNPDIADEFSVFNTIEPIKTENIELKNKAFLKKTIYPTKNINEKNYIEYFIKYAENDLSNIEINELLAFIKQNTILEQEFKQYQKTLLKSDLSVNYPNKEALKKTSKIINFSFQNSLKIAASIVLFLASGYFVMQLYYQNKNNKGNTLTAYYSNLKVKNNTIEKTVQLADNKIIENKNNKTNYYVNDENKLNITEKKERKTEVNKIPVHKATINLNTINYLVPDKLVRIEGIKSNNKQKMINDLYKTPKQLAGELIKKQAKKILKDDEIAEVMINKKEKEPLFWMEKAVEGFNSLFNANIKFDKDVDESGKLLAYSVKTKIFEIEKK